jgi:hypothetical protein
MTAYSARASSLVQLLDDVLAGRDPKGPKVPAILTALGWPYEEKMRAERARLARQGTFPVVLDLNLDEATAASAAGEPVATERGEHGPEVVVPARVVKPKTAPLTGDHSYNEAHATPLDEAADEAYPDGDPERDDTIPDDLADFLTWATHHKLASVRNETERILARIDRVRHEVTTYRDRVEADQKRLARIRELEAELLALRSKSLHRCTVDGCDVTSTTGAGLAAHRRHAHAGATP